MIIPCHHIKVTFVLSGKENVVGLKEKLTTYAENKMNVMLIGSHGIGKTVIVKELAEQMGLRFKYYSSSTLDPWTQLVGVPVPDKENKVLNLYRPRDIQDADFIFFDELNRASPRVLNAVLEIVQFKSINGERLKNLKMVWCAINPPGDDYQVEDLDPALIDRFHVYVKMKASINIPYLTKFMKEETAQKLKSWWQDDLDNEQRRILTPRRIEYIGTLIDKSVPYRDAIPQGHTFPVENLDRRLRGEKDLVLDKESILENKDTILEEMKKNPKIQIKLSESMKKFSAGEILECKDLLEAMSKEHVFKVIKPKFVRTRKEIERCIDSEPQNKSAYPKILEACRD